MWKPLLLATTSLLLPFASPTAEADWRARSGGQVGVSTRAFYPDDNPETEDLGLALESELEYKGKSGGWRTHVSGFGRVGVLDNSRSIAFLKDAWVGYRTDAVEVRIGAQVLNWTATEAFHPSDVINSRNLDSNLENSEKIGEPMARIRFRMGQGDSRFSQCPCESRADSRARVPDSVSREMRCQRGWSWGSRSGWIPAGRGRRLVGCAVRISV